MSKNDEINRIIKESIIQAQDSIFACKAPEDLEVLTFDGIIAEGDTSPDLLFLLKEANDGRNSAGGYNPDFADGFDFVSHARCDAQGQAGKRPIHWDNLCYWTRAYQDAVKKEPHYFTDDVVKNSGGLLGEISLVNIKKVPGGSMADGDYLLSTVTNPVCAALVRNEISLIKPKVVVCCGTYEYAKEIYKQHHVPYTEAQLECGAYYFVHKDICFLEFIHPTQYGAAAKRSMTYAYAKEVFQNLVDTVLVQ